MKDIHKLIRTIERLLQGCDNYCIVSKSDLIDIVTHLKKLDNSTGKVSLNSELRSIDADTIDSPHGV